MIRSLWSDYIVVFDKEMIETVFMKRLWLHSVLILLVESHGSRYQTLFVNQGRHHTWRDLCHRHFVFVQLFLLKHDSLNDYFWIQIDNYKKHCFVRETYRAYRWPFFQWKNLTNSTTEQTEQTRQTDSMIDFGEFPSLSLESPSVVTSIQYVCYFMVRTNQVQGWMNYDIERLPKRIWA